MDAQPLAIRRELNALIASPLHDHCRCGDGMIIAGAAMATAATKVQLPMNQQEKRFRRIADRPPQNPGVGGPNRG